MEQSKVSWYLIGAGVLAALGGLFLLLAVGPALANACRISYPEWAHLYWPGLIYLWIIGLVYAWAMAEYFRIVRRIGKDQSFCRENARGLARIALSMWIAGGLWIMGIWLPRMIWGLPMGPAVLYLLLAAMASAAMGVLAWGLGKLLHRAVVLKEENDLTV